MALVFGVNCINGNGTDAISFSGYFILYYTVVGFPGCHLFWFPCATVMDGANFTAG